MGARLLSPSGRYELGAAVASIGRSPANSIVINDALVSAHHAEVWPEGSGYVLVDLDSTNGTALNGQRLPPQMPTSLRNGDSITLGSTRITVEMTSAEVPPTVVASPPGASSYAPTERAARPPTGLDNVSAPAGASPAPEPTPSAVPDASRSPAPPVSTPPGQYPWVESPSLLSYYPDPLPLVPPPPPPPGYSPPPPGGVYGVGMAPPAGKPRAKRRRIILIAGCVALALVVAIVAMFGVTNYLNARSPEGVTKSYYDDLQSQDYQDAYQYLDSRAQHIFDSGAASIGLADGQQLFTNSYTCLDHQLGEIASFTTSGPNTTNMLARVQVSVTRAEIGTYTEVVKLIQENGAWKVDDVTFLIRGASSCFSRPQGQSHALVIEEAQPSFSSRALRSALVSARPPACRRSVVARPE